MASEEQERHYVLVIFFVAVFAITWPCFSAVGTLSGGLRLPLLYLGIFAPALVSLTLTAWHHGSPGVIALLRRLFLWQVGLRWYVFALSYMAVIKLIVAVIYRLLAGAWPRFGSDPWYIMIAATVISTAVGGQAGEEIGWRGFALPRLASRFGYGWGSVLLGPVWALWHLPLFFTRGADTFGQSFIVYSLQVTALSVALAWLYMKSNGSLLLVMLMHAAVNNTKDIVPSALPGAGNPFTFRASPVAWLTVTLLWVGAAYFLFRMRAAALDGGNMAKVTGIGGVFFKSRNDSAALTAWYQKHLGMPLEKSFGGAILRWPDDKAEDKGLTVWMIAKKESKWFSPSDSSFMINYRVDNLDDMIAQLRAGGVEIIQGPESAENGKFAWILDPDGNKVELWEPMKWDEKNKTA